MNNYLLVLCGGGLGALARYALSAVIFSRTISWHFPISTFIVNVLGCALAGVWLGVSERFEIFTGPWRVFLVTGVLGGFTTFSAFGIETFALIKRGLFVTALAYTTGSVVLGVAALIGAFALVGHTGSR